MILDLGDDPRFQLVRRLGVGGMGAVYEVLDKEHGVHIALKALMTTSPEAVARFKREFRAVQDLRHPNLVALGELFERRGQWFFTMELVPGVDLMTWVRPAVPAAGDTLPSSLPAAGGFDEGRLRASLGQLAAGLSALHGAGKVHRDVKPSNVRVTPEGRVVLLDFGLVRDTAAPGELSGDSPVGTTAYMAPEQAAAGKLGPEADWYAFGTVLYQALTGRLPFVGGLLEVMLDKQKREPPAPSTVAKVPADLDALCTALLRFDPAERPTGRQVIERLGGPTAASPAATREPPTPTPSRAPQAPFVGRGAELARLAEAYADTLRGRARTLVLLGESGVGKSALARRFAEHAGDGGARPWVLYGRCYERESVPYKALDGAMEDVTRHLAALDPVDAALVVGDEAGLSARLFPVLAQLPAVRKAAARVPGVLHPHDLRERAVAALRRLLERAVKRQPVILLIDDLQWADADSLQLLADLFAEPEPPAVLLVATAWRDQPAVSTLLATLPGAQALEVGGLPADDARELAARLARGLEVAVDPDQLATDTGGHPLFLHELVRQAAERGGSRQNLRLDDALHARVDQLQPGARDLLEVLAIAGAPLPLKVAAIAAGRSAAEAQREAALLRVAMLARSAGARASDLVEPYHERVRVAVARRLAGRDRALHARIADALAEVGVEDARLLIVHLEASGQADAAARQAVRAARQATSALAFDRAAELYARALALGQFKDDERRQLLEAHGDVLSNAGRSVEAAEAWLTAAALPADGATRLALRRRAAEQLLVAGQVERGLAELRTVFAEAGQSLPATPGGAVASILWNRMKLAVRGRKFTPRDPSEIPPRDLQLLELHRAVAAGLSHVDYVRGADFNLRCLLRARQTGQSLHVLSSLLLLAPLRAAEGGHRRAAVARLLGEAEAIAARHDDPSLPERLLGAHGLCEYLLGDFASALPKLEAADDALRERGGNVWQANNYRAFTMFGLHYLGRYDTLGEKIARYQREARRGDVWMAAALDRGRDVLELALGKVWSVRARTQAAWGPRPPGFYQLQRWFLLMVRCSLAMHDRPDGAGASDEMAELRDETLVAARSPLMRLQIVRVEEEWTLGRFALIAGDAREARRRLARLGREDVAYARARAALLAAGLDPTPAMLRRSQEICEAEGYANLAACARLRLGDPSAAERFRSHGAREPRGATLMQLPILKGRKAGDL